jgi:predicted TIM-barrel fold metal-dependent hydrolase
VPRRSLQPLAAAALLLLLPLTGCRSAKPAPAPARSADALGAARFARIPKIDFHAHVVQPAALRRALEMTKPWGVVHYVNLSAGPQPDSVNAFVVAAQLAGGRMSVFTNLRWKEPHAGPGYGARMVAGLEQARREGAVGVKISKGLGLAYVDSRRQLVPVDDPELDQVFEKAGALGLPVSIHTGDPKAFWLPVGPGNERFDELRVHPDWSNHGEPVPSWEELLAQLERRVARHPRTKIVGVHFGNAPEEPARVAAMLDKYPNYHIDTAARVPEIGRRSPAEMRQFFIKYQDRILFGTDLGVGLEGEALMLGSTGEEPPKAADVTRFYDATFRYFETDDRDFDHPTPIQGRWKISGIKLPREVLEKIYHRNAEKLLGLKEVTW